MVEVVLDHLIIFLRYLEGGDYPLADDWERVLMNDLAQKPGDCQVIFDELSALKVFYHANPNAPVGAARNQPKE